MAYRLAQHLASLSWECYSGHAAGMDQAFEKGAGTHATVYLPFMSFNKNVPLLAAKVYNYPTPLAMMLARKFHPAWDRLGSTGQLLMARNTHQVLGRNCNEPVDMQVCWTPNGRETGGTAQSMRLCRHYGVPVYNLAIADDVRKLEQKFDIELDPTRLF